LRLNGGQTDLPRSCPASVHGIPRFTSAHAAAPEASAAHPGLEHDAEPTVSGAAAAVKALDQRATSERDHPAKSGSGRRVAPKAEGTPADPADTVGKVRRRPRARRADRQKQIADVTLKLVAKYGVHGATITRIAAGVGLSRAALYKFFPNREAMLEAALDRLIGRVPRWIARSPGDTAFEHLMGMGNQFGTLGMSVFESFTQPWFQFVAAGGTGRLTQELAKRQLIFVRDFAVLIEQGKRDGSIREDVDSNLIAWSLMMWAWASDVARLVGLEQVMGSETEIEIFKRMLGDIAAREVG